MLRLSARPHDVGSAYDKDNAEWVLDQFKSYGWDVWITKLSSKAMLTRRCARSFALLPPFPQSVLEILA